LSYPRQSAQSAPSAVPASLRAWESPVLLNGCLPVSRRQPENSFRLKEPLGTLPTASRPLFQKAFPPSASRMSNADKVKHFR
jgi:hypothetical protein